MVQNDNELTKALELIKKKDFARARDILMRIDHPLAEQWLQKIMMQGLMQRSTMNGLVVESPVDLVGEDEPLISMLEARQIGFGAIIASVIVFGVAVILAFITGFALFWITNLVQYHLIVYPVLAVLVAGIVLNLTMGIFGVKSRHVVTFIALTLGMLTYSYYWYLQYEDFVNFTGSQAATLFNTQDELNRSDEVLLQMTGETGMVGYVLFRAEEGQEIERGQIIEIFDEFAPRLDRDFSLAYWGLELVLMLVIALITTANRKQKTLTF